MDMISCCHPGSEGDVDIHPAREPDCTLQVTALPAEMGVRRDRGTTLGTQVGD